ncbi:MAG: hypothetical protein JW719_02280 [Pirellulales bacterium]|nr:hypothetical protein [Pirellulales bacterium]
MSRSMARGLLVACVVAFPMIVPPAAGACECLDRLLPWNWCRGTQAATTYAPPYAPAPALTSASAFAPAPCGTCAPATACNPCVSQTCAYVPQTCYRTVCATVPVTTCQAVTSCDPCSGCPVTSYRPVTVYQRTAQLIPYTTYRMVWSNPCATTVAPCGTSCGTTCGTASYASAISFGSPVAGSGSSCCGLRAPASASGSIEPSPETGTSTGVVPQTFVAPPGTAPIGGTAAPQTQIRNMPTGELKDLNHAPVPTNDGIETKSDSTQKLPDIGRDPVAVQPVRRVHYVSDSRVERPAASPRQPVDFGGWRQSSD